MIEPFESSLLFATALFTITNPVGNIAVFAGMTGDLDTDERHATARTAAIAITLTLLIVLWAGQFLLGFFGVSIPALEAAGGIIILHLGLSMLQNKSSGQAQTDKERAAAEKKESVAVVPIAIPIVTGPGAITAILVHAGNHENDFTIMLAFSVVCIVFGLLFWLCFRSAATLSRMVGVHGIAIVTRLMGMILAAIACSMIAQGAKSLMPGLA